VEWALDDEDDDEGDGEAGDDGLGDRNGQGPR
jgi:hypothetical protein